jgi:uncharacterized protein
MAELIQVEVTYAKPDRQDVFTVTVPEGSSIQQVVESSGLLARYPEIDLAKTKVGIYGKLSRMDTVVRAQDRVEVYRPLIADPKEVRKQRAAEGKVMKKGGGAGEE